VASVSASPGRLVLAIALDPREPERQPRGVAGRRLDAVERDLDDELRPHVDGDPLAAGLQREQALGLPREQLVGEPLERLPEHRPAAGHLVAGAEMKVGEPAAAAAVPPLGGQHHEVERVHRLDLEPAGAAAPGRVRRVERLDDDASWPAASAAENAL